MRLSTTVDRELLAEARALRKGSTDGALMDEALEALLAADRAGGDAAYAIYDEIPFHEPDDWGDLALFSQAAAQS